jgi:hypothetical protein
MDSEIRTPELKFAKANFSEAVARPNASDGERSSRGRISPSSRREFSFIGSPSPR